MSETDETRLEAEIKAERASKAGQKSEWKAIWPWESQKTAVRPVLTEETKAALKEDLASAREALKALSEDKSTSQSRC